MTPVVNGLKDRLSGQVAFRSLNAGFGEGKEAFEAYRLPGHPSYIILKPDGTVAWQAFGPQAESVLESAIRDALEAMALHENRALGTPLKPVS